MVDMSKYAHIISRLELIRTLLLEKKQILDSKSSKDEVLDFIKKQGSVSKQDLLDNFPLMNERTLRRHLERLARKKLIRRLKRGRNIHIFPC